MRILFVQVVIAAACLLAAEGCAAEPEPDADRVPAAPETSLALFGVRIQTDGAAGIDASGDRLSVSEDATALLLEGDVSLTFRTPQGLTLRADRLRLDLAAGTATLYGDVVSRFPVDVSGGTQ